MDINDLRAEIDDIDRDLTALFVRRMEVSGRIAQAKSAQGLPIYDAGRERAVLSKVAELAGTENEDSARALYALLMELSRTRQQHILCPESPYGKKLAEALAATPLIFPQKAAVACQGVEGAYSQKAAERLFSAADIHYFPSFDDVFQAVESGQCRYGVLPLENSTAGSVNRIYDLMQKSRFYIVRSVRVHVGHCLLAKKGAALADIREVVSHEQAIGQCGAFLRRLGVKVTACANTAVAAQMVAASDRTDLAALSSSACASLYGLGILEENVMDTDSNYTRFICISRELEIYPGAERTSLMLSLNHRPGALYMVLSKLYALGINIVKLESRPIPGRDFEFMFYFDLEVPVYAPALAQALDELEATLPRFQYLGSHTEVL